MPSPLASFSETDVAVVGAGAAGLYAALCAARERATVVLVSATPLAQTASYWAQGGLAAALATDDSFELHLNDTERAGRALVRHSAAEVLVREAPERVRDLQALGVRFDADRFGRLALGLGLDGGGAALGVEAELVGVAVGVDGGALGGVETVAKLRGQRQGNRVKTSCGNKACEEVVVPGGNFAFEAEAVLAGSFAD